MDYLMHNVLDTWITDFNLKNQLSHRIKAHIFKNTIKAFNMEVENVIEKLNEANNIVDNALIDDKSKSTLKDIQLDIDFAIIDLETIKEKMKEKSQVIESLVSSNQYNSCLVKNLQECNDIVYEMMSHKLVLEIIGKSSKKVIALMLS